MVAALIAGPVVALIGVAAVFFVLRRKSVDKRSMYSARRSQIEHKVRAARQRTLAPHGRTEKPEEGAPAPSPFAPTQSAPTLNYEPAAYAAPPVAPPAPPPGAEAPAAPSSPWEVGPTAPSPFAAPVAEPPPFLPVTGPQAPPAPPIETPPFAPAAGEPAWTPEPAPFEPAVPIEPAMPGEPSGPLEQPAQPVGAGASGGASWSIVGDNKDMSISAEPEPRRRGKQKTGTSWSLASGEAPGAEGEEALKQPSRTIAIAQYAVFVVGLVMVLMGVLIMIGNSHSG
jgi:hypothetical protein